MKKNFRNLVAWLVVLTLLSSFSGCTGSTPVFPGETENLEAIETDNTSGMDTHILSDIQSITAKTISTTSNKETKTVAQVSIKTEDIASNTKATTQKSHNSSTFTEETKKSTTTNSKEAVISKSTIITTTNGVRPTEPMVTTPKFTKSINLYEHKNVETKAGSDEYIAWMSVYCIDDDAANITEFQNKFESVFGFMPTAKIQRKYIGEFLIDGYNGVQKIYQYTIEDSTYDLITDEFYVIKKKICTDGSGWCGFPIPCSMDNMDNSPKVQNLVSEMHQMFCKWYGVSFSYIMENRDKFRVNMISEAGRMRTQDGRVVDVIYRYVRGINMPI